MTCHICNGETRTLFTETVLEKYSACYEYCASCDHVFVDKPIWLEDAYSEAIVRQDTDIVVRNIFTALKLAAVDYFVLGDRGQHTHVDIAGGYGLLTRLMRDLGFDYYWSDLYANNLFARGFEYAPKRGKAFTLSAIEVLEHTTDPLKFIQDNLTELQADILFFTTEVFPDQQPPKAGEWGYYSFETGQHIAFFSNRGLSLLAKKIEMHYYSLGRLHILSRAKLPLWKLRLATNKYLAVPIALFAATRIGSKRCADQTLLRKQPPPTGT